MLHRWTGVAVVSFCAWWSGSEQLLSSACDLGFLFFVERSPGGLLLLVLQSRSECMQKCIGILFQLLRRFRRNYFCSNYSNAQFRQVTLIGVHTVPSFCKCIGVL